MIINEKELIKKTQAGDFNAFGEIYDYYFTKLLNYAHRRTLNYEASEDIVSNTFMKALNNINKFQIREFGISPWLYKIANNEMNAYYNKQNKYAFIPEEAMLEYFSDDQELQTNEIKEAELELMRTTQFSELQKYIAELKPNYQEIVHLRFFEDKSYEELEQILDMKQVTIRSQLSRAIGMLREAMQRKDYQPNLAK